MWIRAMRKKMISGLFMVDLLVREEDEEKRESCSQRSSSLLLYGNKTTAKSSLKETI